MTPTNPNALNLREAREAVLYEVIAFIGNIPVKCLFAFSGCRFIGDKRRGQQATCLVGGQAIGLFGRID
jgi:hypothetical protein